MSAREGGGTQKVESAFAVDGHSHGVAENLRGTQAGLANAVLHQARVRTVHHCREEPRATLLTWAVLEQVTPACNVISQAQQWIVFVRQSQATSNKFRPVPFVCFLRRHRFCRLKFKFLSDVCASVRGCVCECHPLGAKKASVL